MGRWSRSKCATWRASPRRSGTPVRTRWWWTARRAAAAAASASTGQLLYLAVAGCISSDLFREAAADGGDLRAVRVVVRGDFDGEPAVSSPVEDDVELSGAAPTEALRALADRVDAIAELPHSLRRGTPVALGAVRIVPAP